MDLQTLKVAVDTLWVLVTGFLVFFMNLGFAMVESGLCRAKNTVNILSKNFIVFAVSSIAFYWIGFGIMFGNGSALCRKRRALRGLRRGQQPGHGRATTRAPTRP